MLGPFMLYGKWKNETLDQGVNMFDIWTALEIWICGSVPTSTQFGSWSWMVSAMGMSISTYGV